MKYSIILPVRNGGSYVKECVHSILSQTLPDFHFQILDNCSTDGTREWLESLNDPRITIYPADRSLTIEENWSRITTISKSEFITLIGHDDILDSHYLVTMDQLIAQHPTATLYQTHFRYIDSVGATLRLCKPMDERQNATEFLAFFLNRMIDVMGTGFMMRSADYDALGGIPPVYPNLLFADFELFVNLTDKSYKATAAAECFAFRLHQSTTTTSSDMKFQRAYQKFIEYLDMLSKENPAMKPVITKYALSFISYNCQSLSHRLLRTPKVKREGYHVADFITLNKQFADRLVPGNQFEPEHNFSVKLARQIDSNALTRSLFLAFKKIFSKPVYS